MSWRIAITVLITTALCLPAAVPTPGVSAPGAAVELASMAAASIDPARVLARHGEAAAAYRIASSPSPRHDGSGLRVRLLAEMKHFREADSLLALSTPLDDDEAVYRYHLQRAALCYYAGHFDRALSSAEAIAAAVNPRFDAYRDFLIMRCRQELGDTAGAARAGRAGRERGVPEALHEAYDEALVEAYQATGNDSDALDLLHGLQRGARGWRDRARYLHAEYEFYARGGNIGEARRVAREMVTRYPGYPETRDVADEIRANVAPLSMSDAELTAWAEFDVGSGDLDEALKTLRALEKRSLGPQRREHRRLLFARYHYRAGHYDRAIALAKPSYRDAGDRRESILILARSYRKTDRERGAAKLYEYFAQTFPNDGKAAEALFVAAHIYQRTHDDAAYARALARLTTSYPSSYYGRTAALLSARRHEVRGETAESIAVLNRLVRRSRGSDESALYYLARAYGSAGDEQNKQMILNKLQSLDRFSFYLDPGVPERSRLPEAESSGRLALDGGDGLMSFLERGDRERQAAWKRIHAEFAVDAPDDGTDGYDDCIRRGCWFLDVGLREWGERELDSARRGCYDAPEQMLELARVYDEHAMPWQSVRMYQRVRSRIPWSRRGAFAGDFRWLLYPTPYPVQVLENASRYGLPPHLAYAMIREESRFDLEAVSRVGAVGLMQIMPETGRAIAHELELPGWEEDDLLDAEVNVAFGVWYASSLLESGRGNSLWMLAAYNAGPGNARRWFREHPSDPIEAVDNIDFKETRRYVQRIVESAKIYHSLYFGPGAFDAEPPR